MAHLILRHEGPDESTEQSGPGFGMNRARPIVCYTDSHVIRGTLQSNLRRLSDALNNPEQPFLVLEEITLEDVRTGAVLERAEYGQVNLSTVLFAYEPGDVQATPPELRAVKIRQSALVSLPPFRVVGELHLLPERSLRDALRELLGRFIPLTGASFWSETLGIPRTTVTMIAFNHERSQILAPFEETAGHDSGA